MPGLPRGIRDSAAICDSQLNDSPVHEVRRTRSSEER